MVVIKDEIKEQIISHVSQNKPQAALHLLQEVKGYEAIAGNLLNRLSRIYDNDNAGLWERDKTGAHYNQLNLDILDLLSGNSDDFSPKVSSPYLPLLPNNYIQRSDFFSIEEALLIQSQKYYGITGLPGCGKSVLAAALARSKKIQLAFEGNVFWVGIGEKTQDKLADPSPMPYQEQLYLQLNSEAGSETAFKTWQHGLIALQNEAREKFAETKCLIIVDHPPGIDDLLESIEIHENAIFLVITFDSSLLYSKGIKRDAIFSIEGMNHDEAIQLLSNWAELNSASFFAAAEQIVAKLDYLPLAIAMAGASLKGSIDAEAAWSDILDAIHEGDLDDISHPVDKYHSRNLSSLFKWTLGQLEGDDRERFYDLGIFPQGWLFELDKLFIIWKDEPERKIRRLVQRLTDKALLQGVGENRFVVHNLIRLYIRNAVKDPLPVYKRVLPSLFPVVPLPVLASAWNDEGMLKKLVGVEGINVNEENPAGLTALNVAAIRGHDNIVILLLKQGALIDQKNKYEKTALLSAAQMGQQSVVDTLIKHGADINTQDSFGFTPVHHAAEFGFLEIIRLLLDNGAVPNLPDKNQSSPLYHAASEGHAAVVAELLKRLPLADHITHPLIAPLSFAVGNAHIDVIKVLLDAGEDVNRLSPGDGTAALHYAAEKGNAAVTEFLIKAGARTDIKDVRGFVPLHFAAKGNQADVVTLLIAAGADVNAIDGQNFTSLHYAANTQYPKVVAALIAGGADVNLAPKQVTPLHFASMRLDKEIVRMLLDAGAEVDCRTGDGYTALILAVSYLGQLVLKAFSQTSLFSITEEGFTSGSATSMSFGSGIEVIELLLQRGASPNAKTDEGYYSLHFAIWNADVECVTLLLKAGASLQITHPVGKTLTELAIAASQQNHGPQLPQRYQQIIELLRSNEA